MKAMLIVFVQLLVFQLLSGACWASGVDLGKDVYDRAMWAVDNVFSTSYRHNNKAPDEQVAENARTGELKAATDSSGFLSWVLFSVSPGHLYAIQDFTQDKDCPSANAFAQFFAQIPRREMCNGWLNVPSALELTRGDVIALGVTGDKKGDDGRVMVAASAASEVKTLQVNGRPMKYVSVLVVDSSPRPHFGPEKLPPLIEHKNRDGLGVGWVRIFVDDRGKPIGISLGENPDTKSSSPQNTICSIARPVGPALFGDNHPERLYLDSREGTIRRRLGIGDN